jgi:GABA(A) receptor-associated protein
MGFKSDFEVKERIQESKKIVLKYPTRIPIIVEKDDKCKLNNINKKKYLVPRDMAMNQFIFIIRKRINLESSQSLFVMVGGRLTSSNMTLGEIYENHKDEDGFLYMIYTSENTFG